MRPFATAAAFAAMFLLTPRPCFAEWLIAPVGREEAKTLGLRVRVTDAGPGRVVVRLEFRTNGELKGFSRVELLAGKGGSPLQADRSNPGRASFGLVADRATLDRITLRVLVPEELGGSIYDVRVKDFVEPEKD